jgi:hypothetical protein
VDFGSTVKKGQYKGILFSPLQIVACLARLIWGFIFHENVVPFCNSLARLICASIFNENVCFVLLYSMKMLFHYA